MMAKGFGLCEGCEWFGRGSLVLPLGSRGFTHDIDAFAFACKVPR